MRFATGDCRKAAPGLSLQVDKLLQHGIRDGNDTGIRLEAALGGNHFGKLGGKVNIGHFQRVAL